MANEGFRIAGAYVEVHLKDETEGDERRMRARLESSGPVTLESRLQDPENTRIVKERIEAGEPAKIRTDADTKLAQAKIRELAASRNAAVISIDADIAKAQARIENLEAKRGKTKIDVDAEVGKAQAKIEALQAKKNRILVQAEVDDSSLKKTSDKVESETAKMAKRANAQFSALAFGAMFAGLPVAAAAAGVAAAGALAVVPAAFIGIAVAAQGASQDVMNAWSGVGHDLVASAQGWTAPFAGEFVNAASQVTATVHQLSPQISAAFAGAVPSVAILTDAVTGFATRVMPGFVTAINSSKAPLLGLQALIETTGNGVNDFFANLSQGAQASQGIMQTTGGIIRDLLGFAGNLFANLSNNGGPALQSFRSALQQVEGTLQTLTADGSAVYAFFGGFGNAVNGMLGTVRAASTVLAALPDGITQFGGALAATSMIAGKFGLDIGSAFEGLGGKFKAAVTGAGTFKSAFTGLLQGGLNPLTLGLVTGSILLDLFGQSQQKAAQKAAEHKQAVDNLTASIQQDNGVMGAATQATVSKALSDKNAAANSKAFGSSLAELTAAATGSASVMQDVRSKSDGVIIGLLRTAGASTATTAEWINQNHALLDVGGSYATFKDHIQQTNEKGDVLQRVLAKLTPAQRILLEATLNGSGALGEQARAAREAAAAQTVLDEATSATYRSMSAGAFAAEVATNNLTKAFATLNTVGGDAAAKGAAIISVLDRIGHRGLTTEDALQGFNGALRTISTNLKQTADDQSKFNAKMVDGSGAIDTTTAAGSAMQDVIQQAAVSMATYGQVLKDAGVPSDQITAKLAGLRGELEKQLKQAGLTDAQIKVLLDHYGAVPGEITTELKVTGDKVAEQQITDIVSKLLDVPASKGIQVNALTSAAQQNLLQLGYEIVRLPDGSFRVFANTEEGKKAADALVDQVGNTRVAIVIDGNPQPANGKITATVQKVDGSTGTMAVDARIDPATQQTQIAVRQANGARGYMTVDAFNDAAKQVINGAVVVANNARGFIQVDASAGAANAAIDHAARDRSSTITVNYVMGSAPTPGGGTTARIGHTGESTGGIVSAMASGGVLGLAGGGNVLTPMRSIAQVVPKDTWRVVGDNLRVPEAYIPLDGSARSNTILDQTNAAMGRTPYAAPTIDYGALASAVAESLAAVLAGGVRARWDTASMEKGLITLERRRARR